MSSSSITTTPAGRGSVAAAPREGQVRTLSPALKALGDENRLRILVMLTRGERCVCELQEDLGLGQSLLSFHLKTLREAGLVSDRREGRWIHYALDPEGVGAVEEFLEALGRAARAAASRPDGEGSDRSETPSSRCG